MEKLLDKIVMYLVENSRLFFFKQYKTCAFSIIVSLQDSFMSLEKQRKVSVSVFVHV